MGLTHTLFIVFVVFLIVERLAELRSARRNFAMLIEEGGREFGYSHYPIIVGMHVAFFVSLITEYILRAPTLPAWWPVLLALFFLGQLIRLWGRRTMGHRWTTRVVVVKGERLIHRGPYKFIPHPIYVAVALELFSLPLIFGLYTTCALFTLTNAIVLLGFRIPAERSALEWSQGKESGNMLVEQ